MPIDSVVSDEVYVPSSSVVSVFRTPYNEDVVPVDRSGISHFGPSKVQQGDLESTDINLIVERYAAGGQLPSGPARLPEYGDFSGVSDFRTAMEVVREAQDNFMSVSPSIRAKFGNDPVAFVEFALNKDNLPELRKLGLAPEAIKSEIPVVPDKVSS